MRLVYGSNDPARSSGGSQSCSHLVRARSPGSGPAPRTASASSEPTAVSVTPRAMTDRLAPLLTSRILLRSPGGTCGYGPLKQRSLCGLLLVREVSYQLMMASCE